MDLNNLAVYNMAIKNVKYLSERQKVLATNVANVNTPDYVAKDVQRPDFTKELKASTTQLAVTNPKHFAAVPSRMPNGIYTPKPSTALTLDGNGVSIEDQLNEVSKTKSEQDRMLTIYSKYNAMLKLANTKLNV